jgi:uncharacterized protein (DUF302 family)
MFDYDNGRPEAGLFAPCSMYMYIKKGSNKLVIGMPTLQNWSDTLNITDSKRIGLVHKLDKEIPQILRELGMKATPNVNPLTIADKENKKTPEITKNIISKKIQKSNIPDGTLAVIYTLEGDDVENKYNKIIEEDIKSIDFTVTDPHHRVNDQYKKRYGSTVLDVLSFLSVVNDKMVLPLLNIDPRIASTAPFNMLIHKKLNEKSTYVGHLAPKVFLDMIGIEDKQVRDTFTASFNPLDKHLEEAFKKSGLKFTKSYMPYKKLPEKRMINFEYNFEAPEDLEDFIDEFQNDFETAFIDKKYLIAGYHNFMESTDNAGEILKEYDAFWTYSLCHLKFSYNMFDNKDAHPEAGLFAPCTMYMYIKKGTNKLVIGMLRLHNWSDTLGIKDNKRIELVEKLDIEIPQILKSIGMKATKNVNPLTIKNEVIKTKIEKKPTQKVSTPQKAKRETKSKTGEKIQTIQNGDETINIIIPNPPKVPSVIKVNVINGGSELNTRSIKFSKRIPPNYIPPEQRVKKSKEQNTNTKLGEVVNGKISAYLRGKYLDVKTAQKKLKDAGFTVISTSAVNKKGDLISIVFTSPELVKMASKTNRGFMASLRLLVNKKTIT